jgi:hypothetical protein
MTIIGDYKIGETLLAESASVIELCDPPPPSPPEVPATFSGSKLLAAAHLPDLSHLFSRSRTPSPPPALAPPPPIPPRRMLLVVVGLRPHRKLWTTSARPNESVIQYQLMNGCVSVVVPVRVGAPLLAWHGYTLEQLWDVVLPPEDTEVAAVTADMDAVESNTFEGIVSVLCEYLELCVDWTRLKMDVLAEDNVKKVIRDAVMLLVASAVRSGASKEAREQIDKERSGIAMWRIP